ncbi:DUF2956 family protein [Colwellia sp. PAMC 21821]|uniref:DUF2956 family protein n=1 Tax=Colwellia sp. PAMC 21821 TaxID=1816219 RepID=UPI0009BCFB2E|nr:DUF2956 family protein [Colwellia sp. PAMC 21821]ARD46558.1 hypothetical protein A3Q33_06640 [Colwellia sp. PAMC 21821]
MPPKVSTEVQSEALRIAKGTQKKAQTKEQTKLIAQGIEKGISEYKKQQKVKSRERDKQRKKTVAVKTETTESSLVNSQQKQASSSSISALGILPWLLLLVSWGYFLLAN